MSDERPIAASRLHVSIALVIQLVVLISAGYAMVARLDERLAGVEETVKPLGQALIDMGRMQEKLETQKETIRLLERDIKLNESHIRNLEIQAGVQEVLDRREP